MRFRHRLIGAGLFMALLAGSVPRLAAEERPAAEETGLGIQEVLAVLHQEMDRIRQASKASGKRRAFVVDKASLRIQFVMVREAGPEGRSRLKIVPVEVGHDYPPDAVHSLTIQIEPPDRRQIRAQRQEVTPRRRVPSPIPQRQPQQVPREETPQESPQEPPQEPRQEP